MSTGQSSAGSLFSSICKPEYQKKLNDLISQKQATVFSTTYCPFCVKATKILDRNNVEYSEVKLDEMYGEDQMEIANCVYGEERRFVPYIYYDQKRLGSYGELYQLDQEGKVVNSATNQQ